MKFNTTESISYCIYKCCGMSISTGHSTDCKYYFDTARIITTVSNSTSATSAELMFSTNRILPNQVL